LFFATLFFVFVFRVLRCADYYDILQVPRDVASGDLKKQYKHLALALHPDKNRAPLSEDAFKGMYVLL
jgi:DnaJ-class molecular chaperone